MKEVNTHRDLLQYTFYTKDFSVKTAASYYN